MPEEALSCHICQSKKLHKFLSLGPIPLANSFLPPDQLGATEPYYPLDVCFCSNCGLVQLAQVIAPEIMFKDYAYLTGHIRADESPLRRACRECYSEV